MPNELNIALTTGRTITARLILGGAYVGSAITCTEAPASSGHYSGSVLGGTGAGHYSVLFLEGSTIVGTGSLLWDGTAERTALDLPTTTTFEARTLPTADYFVMSDYTAPPTATANATAVRTELSVELGRIDATISSRSTYDGSDTPGTVTLVSRLTSARAGYLDKLNVSGTLAHSDAAATYWADVSGLLTTATYNASLPANFGDLAIAANTGLVTTSNPASGGGLAQETLDAIAAILGHTSYIANAVEAGDIETDTSGLLTSAAYTDSLPNNFGELGINASGHIERVVLVDTTTSNTDMRGTDGAITTLGTNAPADWINAAAIASDAVSEIQSGLLTIATYAASLPANFADLAIAPSTGFTTITNPGSTAAQIWAYAGRTLDGSQASALTDILEDTSTTIPDLIAALPTVAQVEAAGFTVTRHNALISAESAALAVADGRHAINYSASTATQYNIDGNVRKVFDLYDVDGNLATSPETAVERSPR